MIGLISAVSIVAYRSAKRATAQQEPGLLAGVGMRPDAQPMAETEPSQQTKIVQAAAFENPDESSQPTHNRANFGPVGESFVEQNPGAIPAGNFHSSRYGYTVTLVGTNWTRWNDLSSVMPEAEWGALLKNYGRFLVMPVQLSDEEASSESVDRTLLAQFGFQYPNMRSTDLETIQRWGAEGHVFRISRDISGRENVYRIWIFRRDRNAYLVAAWIDRTAAMNALGLVEKTGTNAAKTEYPAIDGVQLDAEIDSQLDVVLNRFKLNDAAAGAQSQSDQRQPLRHLVRLHVLQAIFDR